MKITIEDLLKSIDPLRRLFEQEIPIQTTFRLKKVTKEVQDNLNVYEESHRELLKKYGELQEDGTYKVPDKNQEKLDKDWNDLIKTELTLGFQTISCTLLGNINMSQKDATSLEWLIVE